MLIPIPQRLKPIAVARASVLVQTLTEVLFTQMKIFIWTICHSLATSQLLCFPETRKVEGDTFSFPADMIDIKSSHFFFPEGLF